MAEAFLFAVPYDLLAGVVLTVHLGWILWVVFGALLTRHSRLLTAFHLISLVYAVAIEVGPWPCPLTLAEQWLQSMHGTTPYTESFLVHYLGKLVYPDVSRTFLVWCAVAVAAINLGVYGRRLWRTSRRTAPRDMLIG